RWRNCRGRACCSNLRFTARRHTTTITVVPSSRNSSTPWHRSKPYSRHCHCCGHCWPWKTVTAANGPTATRHACSTWTCCFMTRSSRSEEHTSELQSREKLVCRLLLEKNKLVYRTNIN